jgi:hypothetical protein
MINPSQSLSNPAIALALRAALGLYVIYMSRKFYADPTGYFRRATRGTIDIQWLAPVIRGLSCFCLWGGCFIVVTAIAVQILGLHGDLLAISLIGMAAIAAWFLLPREPSPDRPNGERRREIQ